MKKLFIGFLCFLAVKVFCFENLVKNSDFENIKENLPIGWSFNYGGGGKYKGSVDNLVFFSGNYSVKVENEVEKGWGHWSSSINSKPLTRYRLTIWYKTEKAKKPAIAIPPVLPTQILKESSEWTKYEIEFQTQQETSISLHLGLWEKGIVWYDNVSIIEISPARKIPYSIQNQFTKVSKEEAEKLKDQAIYTAFYNEIHRGHQKEVRDPTAIKNFCIRIDGDAPPYFAISWRPDINKILPGFIYTLYGVFKVNKKGNEGTAFRTGVYDGINRRYVINDSRPLAKDVENNIWETYKIGTFEFQNGQFVYVGPTKNVENIPEIFVDYFFILPGDEECKNFYEDAKGNKTIKFYLRPEKESSLGLRLKEREITIGYLITDDKREWEDSFIGLVIDYHTERGYTKRVLLSLGICGKKIVPGEKIDLGYGKETIDEIINISSKEEIGKYKRIKLNLTKYAPEKWDGEVWITFITKNSLATFSGQIISPEREKMNILEYKLIREKNEEAGIDIESLEYIKEKIKTEFFKSGMEKLKSLQK